MKREPQQDLERGSSLVLALIFVVVVSLVVLALADWVTNDLSNTNVFSSAAQLNSTLRSATELGIQNIRFQPMNGVAIPGPGNCWTPQAGATLSQVSIPPNVVDVWCQTALTPSSPNTRVVILEACPSSVSAATCEATPSILAEVSFDDYSPADSQLLTTVCTYPDCGYSATVLGWYWSPSAAQVTQIINSLSNG
jgi:hypothetical protein